MKKYKMAVVTLAADRAECDNKSFAGSIKAMFEASHDDFFQTQKAEEFMQQMNREGWEVVSAAPCDDFKISGDVLITFEKEC